jgi:hypothetical protein
LLASVEIGHIKSFSEPQKLDFARPDGTRGSGYNVIVGANNSGKSTIATLVRQLFSYEDTITIGKEARYDPVRPILNLIWDSAGHLVPLGVNQTAQGALYRKEGDPGQFRTRFRFVPSRRPFTSTYNAGGMSPTDYEVNELQNRQGNPGYFDGQLATAIAKYFIDPDNKAAFLETLRRTDARSADFTTDNLGGINVMLYEGPSKRAHVLSDTGDGITNLIRIIFVLVTSAPGDCIVVDEPELSLHPQVQRNLYLLLLDYSKDRQITVVTHSPHFVGWKEISEKSKLHRVFVDNRQVDSCVTR